MDKKLRYLIVGLVGIVVVVSVVVPVTIIYMSDRRGLIIIEKDKDFKKYDFPGEGTKNNPYIIKNYNITTTEDNAIFIQGTTKYFVIQNCILVANKSAIYLGYNANGTAIIKDNICSNSDFGIEISTFDNVVLINNTCNNNALHGISISLSDKAKVINNSCNNNNFVGVQIHRSLNAELINNTCEYNGDVGIYLVGSESMDNQMIGNSCDNNRDGIRVFGSVNPILTNNSCINNNGIGIEIVSSSANLFNNTCNDNLNDGIEVWQSHSVILINNTCTNNNFNGIKVQYTDDVVLTNNTCNKNSDNGIYLDDSDSNILTNNSCNNNNHMGIGISESYDVELKSNMFISNEDYGVFLYYCVNAKLQDNNFYNCGLRIQNNDDDYFLGHIVEKNWINDKKLGYIKNNSSSSITAPLYGQLFLVNCTDMIVSNQNLFNASIGLTLLYCENITLTNNTCNNNKYYGIYLEYSTDITLNNNTCNNNNRGIYVHFSSDRTIIIHSTLKWNYYGLTLIGGTDYCSVSLNSFIENSGYGVHIHGSNNNTIHHNSFIDNNLGGTSQAVDLETSNIWYQDGTTEGNFWSEWIGTGVYAIDGSGNNIDPYPLISPPV